MIVYMLPYIQKQHAKIFRTLRNGNTPQIMVERLEKRLKHCRTIMEHYARLDPTSYTFSLTDESHNFGNPLQDFITSWFANSVDNSAQN
jgi:DNA-directed RNA polymerase subunit L